MTYTKLFGKWCTVFVVLCSVLWISHAKAGIIENAKIKRAINAYNKVKNQVSLGEQKEKVLLALEPTQKHLKNKDRKTSEAFYDDKKHLVEIYYYRTGLEEDGLVTDDEFTPYLFVDGQLESIGWSALGGPKTYGQVVPKTHVNVNTTVNPY